MPYLESGSSIANTSSASARLELDDNQLDSHRQVFPLGPTKSEPSLVSKSAAAECTFVKTPFPLRGPGPSGRTPARNDDGFLGAGYKTNLPCFRPVSPAPLSFPFYCRRLFFSARFTTHLARPRNLHGERATDHSPPAPDREVYVIPVSERDSPEVSSAPLGSSCRDGGTPFFGTGTSVVGCRPGAAKHKQAGEILSAQDHNGAAAPIVLPAAFFAAPAPTHAAPAQKRAPLTASAGPATKGAGVLRKKGRMKTRWPLVVRTRSSRKMWTRKRRTLSTGVSLTSRRGSPDDGPSSRRCSGRFSHAFDAQCRGFVLSRKGDGAPATRHLAGETSRRLIRGLSFLFSNPGRLFIESARLPRRPTGVRVINKRPLTREARQLSPSRHSDGPSGPLFWDGRLRTVARCANPIREPTACTAPGNRRATKQ